MDEIEDGTEGGCSYQFNSIAFDALVSNNVMKPKQLTGAFGLRSEYAASNPAGESLELYQAGELQLITTMFLPTQKEITDSDADFASDALSVRLNEHSPWQDSTLSRRTDAPSLMLHAGAKVPNQQLFSESMGPESSQQDTHNYEELLPAAEDLDLKSPEWRHVAALCKRSPTPVLVGGGCGHSRAIGPRGEAASMVSSRTESAYVKEIVVTTPGHCNFGTNDDSMLERSLSSDTSPLTSDTPIPLQRQGAMNAPVSSLCPIESQHALLEIGISSSFISTSSISDFVNGVFYSGPGHENSVFQETSNFPGTWRQISGVEMTF